MLFDTISDVKAIYRSLYGTEKAKDFDAPAFMSRPDITQDLFKDERNLIHSTAETEIKIVVHEICHGLIEANFGYKVIPNQMQHISCWYVEREI